MRNEDMIKATLTLRISHAFRRKIREYCKAKTAREMFNFTPSVLARMAMMEYMLNHPIKEGRDVEPKSVEEEIERMEAGD